MDASSFVLPLARCTDAERFGPKAAVLAEALAAGAPVPDAFGVAAGAYREHAARAGVPEAVQAAATAGPERTRILAAARAALAATPVDARLAGALHAAHAELGLRIVAVRSSAVAEGLPSHSFAGQHGTWFVTDPDVLVPRVVSCWQSLWTEAAYVHRLRAGIGDAGVAMAVLVQALVPAQVAGVAFTADPLTGDTSRILVEGAWGLGETLVSGRSGPDAFTLATASGDLLETRAGDKAFELAVGPRGVEETAVAEARRMAPCLGRDGLAQVRELALAAEQLFGEPVRVEWALTDGRAWLLQARALTDGEAAPDAEVAGTRPAPLRSALRRLARRGPQRDA